MQVLCLKGYLVEPACTCTSFFYVSLCWTDWIPWDFWYSRGWSYSFLHFHKLGSTLLPPVLFVLYPGTMTSVYLICFSKIAFWAIPFDNSGRCILALLQCVTMGRNGVVTSCWDRAFFWCLWKAKRIRATGSRKPSACPSPLWAPWADMATIGGATIDILSWKCAKNYFFRVTRLPPEPRCSKEPLLVIAGRFISSKQVWFCLSQIPGWFMVNLYIALCWHTHVHKSRWVCTVEFSRKSCFLQEDTPWPCCCWKVHQILTQFKA